jgi:hypothetical protein
MPPNERMNIYTVSNPYFVQMNDTATYINGTITYNKQINGPWRAELHLQRYIRGEWLLELKRTFEDVCTEKMNKFE